jgi:cell shape-determining protein MreD
MRDFMEAAVGVLIAFFFYTVFRKISVSLIESLNVFTLAVILIGLLKGEMAGAFMGMACGLIVDSFSLGVFGISGVANTLTGYLTGAISRKVNVVPFLRSLVFIGIMAGLELAVWMGLSALIFGEGIYLGKGLIFLQPVLTAIVGSVLFLRIRKFKANHEK